MWWVEAGANPVRGVRSVGIAYDRSTRLAWGALGLATGGTACMTARGDRPKQPTVKSSTMRGPKGLASEC